MSFKFPRTDVGSEGEGQVLSPSGDQHQFRSIVFVAESDHPRRLRRVLDRAMKGDPTRVTVEPARYPLIAQCSRQSAPLCLAGGEGRAYSGLRCLDVLFQDRELRPAQAAVCEDAPFATAAGRPAADRTKGRRRLLTAATHLHEPEIHLAKSIGEVGRE